MLALVNLLIGLKAAKTLLANSMKTTFLRWGSHGSVCMPEMVSLGAGGMRITSEGGMRILAVNNLETKSDRRSRTTV